MFTSGSYTVARCVSCDHRQEVRASTLCLCKDKLKQFGWKLDFRFKTAVCFKCVKDDEK